MACQLPQDILFVNNNTANNTIITVIINNNTVIITCAHIAFLGDYTGYSLDILPQCTSLKGFFKACKQLLLEPFEDTYAMFKNGIIIHNYDILITNIINRSLYATVYAYSVIKCYQSFVEIFIRGNFNTNHSNY